MTASVLEEFEEYAHFSVRVDRFFHVVRIYGRHHDALKHVYRNIPADGAALTGERIDERVQRFYVSAISSLSYMGTTEIFSDEKEPVPERIPEDVHEFAFYTCFCFQWNLFETFVRRMVDRAIDAHALPPNVCKELRRKQYKTKQFLEYLDSGRVFGHSPFVTVLPVEGWVRTTETCDYADLDEIRELRNDLVHRAASPKITGKDEYYKQKLYDRSMWILRQFASNVQQDVGQAIENAGA